MSRRKGGLRCIGAVIVLAVALAGCGGGAAKKPTPKAGLRLSGENISGTLYLLAGENEFNADVYRVRGSLDHVERLTVNGRVSWISAQPGAVVTANARSAGSDHVETLDLTRTPALPGRVIDPFGQQPELSPTRQVAYSVVRYGADGAATGTLIYVSDLNGSHKRVRLRSRADLAPDWLPHERLVVLSQPNLDRPNRARLILDAGSRGERTIDPGLPQATVLLVAPDGTMLVSGGPRRAVIISPGGARHVIDTDWSPRCWAPDSASLLAVRGNRLALVPAAGGPVRELGRATAGRIVSCAWTPA
jgi:hypothetical protein